MRKSPRSISFVLVPLLAATLACSHFILRPGDGFIGKSVKVSARTVFAVATIGGTEAYVAARKKTEQIGASFSAEEIARLENERDSIIRGYWSAVAFLLVVGSAVACALSGGCAAPSKRLVIHTDPGTCSWHGGVAACVGGIALCADGVYSPGYEPCWETWE